jgi:hypothetical protein
MWTILVAASSEKRQRFQGEARLPEPGLRQLRVVVMPGEADVGGSHERPVMITFSESER